MHRHKRTHPLYSVSCRLGSAKASSNQQQQHKVGGGGGGSRPVSAAGGSRGGKGKTAAPAAAAALPSTEEMARRREQMAAAAEARMKALTLQTQQQKLWSVCEKAPEEPPACLLTARPSKEKQKYCSH